MDNKKIEQVLTELKRIYEFYENKKIWAMDKMSHCTGKVDYYVAVVKVVNGVLKCFSDLIVELENVNLFVDKENINNGK